MTATPNLRRPSDTARATSFSARFTRARGGYRQDVSTYQNPVYEGYFADPFVFRAEGAWYAVGTPQAGLGSARVFPLLRSANLVQWERAGDVLERPDPSVGSDFWAPEVASRDGRFYLYYSAGHGDKDHHLRVAVADRPDGPYLDEAALTDVRACPFAIDPHPFRDDDGTWYLFYARDFLKVGTDRHGGGLVGTGIVVDRLEEMTRLAGQEIAVVRPHFDWQRFEAGRAMYGGVYDWHTVEGPFVRRHEGLYYCFYSGGRWETESYGVDYAEASSVLGPYATAEGEHGPRVLQSVPASVLGPGHCSIVLGPDGITEMLVYHAWDPSATARRMCLDPLRWTLTGPRCNGPSTVPRALPREPSPA